MSSPRLLSNRYEIGETLGYGGMSEVHRGRDVRLGRDVAVKVLRADLARDPTFQLRFRREAQNAAALNHPAIVAVYDTGETESENGPLPYIVMEYVDGRTLRDIVKSEGPLSPRRAMEVMADGSAALDFSHRHGIVHRDVKPANIMITRSGAVKVMDFGIARAVADGQAAVTQTAAVIGTAQYLSPEQARGESVDARSDVYASGCVLFELLTGEPPFTGDSPVAVAYQHVREEPRKPSDVNQQVPASLDAVVLKALSKNPANRYQSAAEMRADLVRVLSGQRPKAPMIMSEEERTSMMAGSAGAGATEVMAAGRHRPASLDDDEDHDEDRRRKRRKGWTAAVITAVCVGVFALVAWLASAMFSGQEEQKLVPLSNYLNQDVQVAYQALSEKGFKPRILDRKSPPEMEGKVVDQKPAANTLVTPGSEVTLWRGSGPGQTSVPDLTGLTPEQASRKLQEAGLTLAPGRLAAKETENPNLVGKVVTQDPDPQTQVPEGSTVSIGMGKEIEEVSVPDVVGQQYSSARTQLEEQGFNVSKQVIDSPRPADEVLEQSLPGGSQAKPGTRITLTVSNGSQMTMPDLTGKSYAEAEVALRAAGWTGELRQQEKETDELGQDGKVVGSNPSPGSTFGKNQTVTLYIGKFDLTPSTSSSPDGDNDGTDPPFDW